MKVPFTWELLRLMIRKELGALNSRAIVFSGGSECKEDDQIFHGAGRYIGSRNAHRA
uniref:Uncharacterized protein n=1 Tax=Musa acuminata subsp. malaccensis TaxID=214687 RepID=A0A804JHZ6_MUSAM